MKYRIPEPGTTISGFVDNKKKINPDRPTLDFFGHVTVNTHVYIFCWPNIFYHRAIYFLSDSKEGQTAHVILQDDRRPPTVNTLVI